MSGTRRALRQPSSIELIGRSVEVAELASLLASSALGPVTVCGPGGIGTSAVVSAVARQLVDRFPGGFVTVDAASLRDAQGKASAVALVKAAGHDRGAAGHARGVLVVVDHADGAAEAVEALHGALVETPGVALVACTVRPLGVRDERAVRLNPLPVPAPGASEEQIGASPAVQLFAQRAASASGRLVPLADDDLQAAAAICRVTGGWPLAVELAAARAGLLPLPALAELLENDLGMLWHPVPRPDRPSQYLPSIRIAFERTWRSLPDGAQLALRTMAVFAGPVGVDQVATVAPMPLGAAVDALSLLANCHQIEPTSGGPVGPRYQLPPLIRTFLRRMVGRSNPRRSIRTRYIDLVCATARQAAVLLQTADEVAAMRAAHAVRAELVPVLDLLTEAGTAERALRLAGDLAPCVVQLGQFHAVESRLDALLRTADLPPGPALATALVGYADLVCGGVDGLDRRELAIERLGRGLRLTERYCDGHATLRALAVVCDAWPVMQDHELATASLAAGLELARQEGNGRWLARFEAWSAMLAHLDGDLATAAALGSSALARGRRSGDPRARLLAGILLLTLPDAPRDVPGGLPTSIELLGIARELMEPRMESIVLAILADRAITQDRVVDAARWCAEGLQLVQNLDTWYGAAFAVVTLVGVARARGEHAQAAQLHGMLIDRLPVVAANMAPHTAERYRVTVGQIAADLGAREFDAGVRSGAVLAWPVATGAALAYARRCCVQAPPTAGRPGQNFSGDGAALTPRELQILEMIAEGQETKTIATRLRLSAHSVSHYTSNILDKLGLANRTQAAIWAISRGASSARVTQEAG